MPVCDFYTFLHGLLFLIWFIKSVLHAKSLQPSALKLVLIWAPTQKDCECTSEASQITGLINSYLHEIVWILIGSESYLYP